MRRTGFKAISISILAGAAVLLLSGCMPAPVRPRPPIEPLQKVQNPPVLKEEGSLWSSRMPTSPYADLKARNVGDIVTISIVESAKASKNATTKTERSSGLEASWSGVFDALAGKFKVGGQPISAQHKIDFANNFDGKGETTRTSFMSAYITAHVVHVLPNGNMAIRGTREVQVNGENQSIFIQGIIRPEDISSSNIVLSTFVADAVIELSGQGPISDKQRPGWLAHILDLVWPF